MSRTHGLEELSDRIIRFCRERDWEQFHNPKNLSMALAVEAAELMEIFQWRTLEQSKRENLSPESRNRVAEEIADVAIYAIRMAQMMQIDLLDAVASKIEKNEINYPPGEARGTAFYTKKSST